LLDDAEIVHYLKSPRLKSFALRSNEILVGFIDDAKLHASTCKIASEG
jgi:hypothetical protein